MPNWTEVAMSVAEDFVKRVEERIESLIDPPAAEQPKPEPVAGVKEGDWVLVYGLVTRVIPALKEVVVRFESHNEHYDGGITTAHVLAIVDPPESAGRCTDLYDGYANEQGSSYLRCTKASEHSGDHVNGPAGWTDAMTTGYVEDK